MTKSRREEGSRFQAKPSYRATPSRAARIMLCSLSPNILYSITTRNNDQHRRDVHTHWWVSSRIINGPLIPLFVRGIFIGQLFNIIKGEITRGGNESRLLFRHLTLRLTFNDPKRFLVSSDALMVWWRLSPWATLPFLNSFPSSVILLWLCTLFPGKFFTLKRAVFDPFPAKRPGKSANFQDLVSAVESN